MPRQRKTVTVFVAHKPEKNKFANVKKAYLRKPTGAEMSDAKVLEQKAEKKAKEFEEFLWDNSTSEFYKHLRDAMNLRRLQAGV